MHLEAFECPNCGAHDMEAGPDQRLFCLFCDTSFGEVTRICPVCGHYNKDDVRHCSECGARIMRDCPVCGADNSVLADHCVQCGRNLDMIDQMARRWQKTTEQRLYEQKAAMISLKEQEERASQERMAILMEAERHRQEALALARESQSQRERQLYIGIGVLILVSIVIMALALLLTASGR